MILKASAAKGSAASARRSARAPESGSIPTIAGTSSGLGRKSTTASSSGCTPLFLKDAPQRTGTKESEIVPRRSAARIASAGSGCPERYSSISASSCSQAASTSRSRNSPQRARRPSGTSSSCHSAPRLSSSQIRARMRTRSTTPAKRSSVPIGVLQGDRPGAETHAHHLQHALEIGAGAVHLVDEGDARHPVFVGLAPDGLGLGLDAADGAENGDGAVEDPQAALHLDGEVDVPRGVDQVDAVFAPETGGGGRGDGDAPLLLLLHVVHGRGPVVHLAHPVRDTGVVEDALGGGGLPGVDVRHDPDVPGLAEGYLPRHDQSHPVSCKEQCKTAGTTSGSVQRPCWPPPSCAYPRVFSRHCRCSGMRRSARSRTSRPSFCPSARGRNR